MSIKYYTKQFAGVLPTLFEKKTAFLRSFGGLVQVKAGAEADVNFLVLKTTNSAVVIQNYSTEAEVAFEGGTGNTNRFGKRTEIKSVDTTVAYEKPLAIHEGVDNFTVNDIPEQVVAERLALHASSWAGHVDKLLGKAISDAASETLEAALTADGVTKLFADAHKKFVNNDVSENIAHVAYVNADVYNLLVDSGLTTTAKNSTVNIDNQTVEKFKGFVIVEMADSKMQADEVAYFVADGVGVAGVGVQVARAMDSETFAGTLLQAAAQYGKYIPEDNKKAILKAKLKK
ncbi:major capsid protein [Brochothrix phage BtpYZU01]|nr:major capsid protein [Brochothrix phage BtpYZU01]